MHKKGFKLRLVGLCKIANLVNLCVKAAAGKFAQINRYDIYLTPVDDGDGKCGAAAAV